VTRYVTGCVGHIGTAAATRYWPSSYRGIWGALALIPIYTDISYVFIDIPIYRAGPALYLYAIVCMIVAINWLGARAADLAQHRPYNQYTLHTKATYQ
jgi:hypothetical protein